MPGSGSSNNNGRSLEYLITDSLSKVKGCKLTDRSVEDQLRDSVTVTTIDSKLRNSLIKAAGVIVPWIISEVSVERGKSFEVDRHHDSDPGVADLTITKASNSLALSVKLNNDALSHPRPYSLVNQMGMSGMTFESDHRMRMDAAVKRFRAAAGGATSFPLVPAAKIKLYQETCEECAVTVNKASSHIDAVRALFDFLVGTNFKKVIVETNNSNSLKSITVADYTKIKRPRSVSASVDHRPRASSLVLNFDNGWNIRLRIKNASTTIRPTGQVDLKFDARKNAGPIPPLTALL
jgi:hypothetical protein